MSPQHPTRQPPSWPDGPENKSKLDQLINEFHAMREKIDSIDTLLRGDLEEGTPGLVGRTKSLEDEAERRKWWTTTSVGAALTAIVTTLVNLFTTHRT